MLYRVTLYMARSKDFPEGSSRFGYEMTAPLDKNGLLDQAEWGLKRDLCSVRRFWNGEPDRRGILTHRSGGVGGATWTIDYDFDRADDDEAGFRLEKHRFAVGEYVTIQDEDEKLHTLQVVAVRPVEGSESQENQP